MRIDVRIDAIVLDGLGLPPHQADAFREALRAELIRLVSGTPTTRWRAVRRHRIAAAATPAPATPTPLGRVVARSLYRELAGNRGERSGDRSGR